ncbi:ferric reductase-like transmembrane domain-containing protein [Desertimonas flava]|jgi:predicted ferric reductase|uniref:ferric reductase-like transmembrane domain-containing protein n=1 Tax=Desertimonas flava TaxID=2064846 RepID=UPI0013C511DA|nr:ferric reductase-like transmembrane domain-containing protein [Desertimonas flava]
MNEQVWWYLARAAGVMTLVLLVAALVLGVLLATRAMKPHDRPAWLLAMHRWLSSLVVVGTAIHVLALVADDFVHFGPIEVLVPMASTWRPVAVTFGVVAMWILVVVHVSSLLMKRLPKRLWRRLHSLSAVLVWCAVVHGALAGTDAGSPVYQAVAWLLVSTAVAAGLIRALIGRSATRGRAGRTAVTDPVASA